MLKERVLDCKLLIPVSQLTEQLQMSAASKGVNKPADTDTQLGATFQLTILQTLQVHTPTAVLSTAIVACSRIASDQMSCLLSRLS